MTRVVGLTGAAAQPGRNDPCPCGTGLKWKRCHGQGTPPDGAPVIFTGAAVTSRAGHWDGRPNVRLRVYLDAGAGDAIHAFRFASWIAARTDATFVTRPSMTRLFRASLPGVRIVDAHPLPPADLHATSLGLLGMSARGELPRDRTKPYLAAPSPWRAEAGTFHAGICERGDRTQAFDRWRSLHGHEAVPLLTLPGVTWYDLSVPPPGGDWADTADIVVSLGVVVSVDTGVAHLAGALGVPLILLDRAPGEGDWGPDDRWDEGFLQPGPLYRGAVVVKQARRGEWRDAVREAARLVAGFAG